jgi:acyl carrier protein
VPSDDITEGVIEVFQRVLETGDVDVDTDFFEAGGDSLLATRVLSAVARTHGAELTIVEFINAPTPGALAKQIESMTA